MVGRPSLRVLWLALLCGTVGVVTVGLTWATPPERVPDTWPSPPQQVGAWRFQSEDTLKRPYPGRRYQYQLSGQPKLTVEVRFLAKPDVDIPSLLTTVHDVSGKLTRQAGVGGAFGLAQEPGAELLTGCVSAQGQVTLSEAEFRRGRREALGSPAHMVGWLAGRNSLRDWRCLWVILSVDTKNTSTPAAESILEPFWPQWRAWATEQLQS
ncbi:MAG: hypothetical protein IGQ88_03455 [Gloeomargaritaceae cyanobacterium C42_A2020_066]|nr:hypothetical protein [Gloeomargaritaceae cyanobacterium C42_A2020_066]